MQQNSKSCLRKPIVFKGRQTPKSITEHQKPVKLKLIAPCDSKLSQQKVTQKQKDNIPPNEKCHENGMSPTNDKLQVNDMSKQTQKLDKTSKGANKDNGDTLKSTTRISEAKNDLKCGLCYKNFHEPKQLSCLHSFCLICLQRYVERGKYKGNFPCPFCNTSIEIPKPGGMKALQANMHLTVPENFDDTLLCGICDKGNRAVDRCLDCEENMCSNCLSYHSKMKATRVHKILPIGGTAKIKRRIQQKQFCNQHENKELQFYCVPCAKSVCMNCQMLNHAMHQVLEIKEVAESCRREIAKSLKNTKEYRPKILTHIKTFNALAKQLEKNLLETMRDIKNQAMKFHAEIERMTDEMISDIKKKNKEIENTIQKNLMDANIVLASVESVVLAAEAFMDVSSDNDVIENSVNIKNKIENLHKELPSESVDFFEFKFSPGYIQSTDLWNCFGHWSSYIATNGAISIQHQIDPAMLLKVQEISSFKVSENKAIISIALSKDGNAWICTSLSGHVSKYNITGQCKAHIKNSSEVGDLHMALDESVLICLPSEKKIRRLVSNGSIIDYANLPMYPAGVTQTYSGDVLVCAVEQLDESVRGSENKGVIFRVNNLGHVNKFEKERTMTMFKRPVRITVNANKDIIVCEWAKGNDHVVALTANGKIKWKYSGPQTMVLENPFVPNSIISDKHCQILIADSNNRSIHLLDRDGNFLKLLLTANDGLGEVCALAIDRAGFLWVGDTVGCVKVYQYMI